MTAAVLVFVTFAAVVLCAIAYAAGAGGRDDWDVREITGKDRDE